jgi:hypothetical protein
VDEEEHHVEVQREASAAGLLAVVFLMFLTGAALIVGFTFWPVIQSATAPANSLPESNSD